MVSRRQAPRLSKNAAVPRPPSIVLTVLLGAEKFTTGGKKCTNKYGDSHYITETPFFFNWKPRQRSKQKFHQLNNPCRFVKLRYLEKKDETNIYFP